VLFFISTATTSSGAYPALDQPAGDLSDALVEAGVGNILAPVLQRTAGWCSPSMKGDEAGKVDHPPLDLAFSASFPRSMIMTRNSS
jgi:hypothetical protein